MKNTKLRLDDYEINIIVKALVELRNKLIRADRYTDAVDELLMKLLNG